MTCCLATLWLIQILFCFIPTKLFAYTRARAHASTHAQEHKKAWLSKGSNMVLPHLEKFTSND